ncbi:hypothetical protein K435DRAFT_682268 [Dendrothele bispora CBS 962.96]|uniref:DUF6589 domain-containing protein n=1 Tax=Dendrothele bispora (strain CBS 962.96) TaxID=1314807 RepID=A0A4S8LDY7_DENBC|nr:hypothetical protein K435DRAFT_682268 [Dendrothele bispora CBS 962.96]
MLEDKRDRALQAVEFLISSEGFGFKNLTEFIDALDIEGGDNQTRAKLAKLHQLRGGRIVKGIFQNAPNVQKEITQEIIQDLAKEGQAIQRFLTRSSDTPISELLKTFSMENLGPKLQELAPVLWRMLREISGNPEKDSQRDADLVLTTVCAMVSILRSDRANNFQAVMGLFLLASGASKRETEVLHHAGFCLSYPAVIKHLRQLSAEAKEIYRKLLQQCMCFIVWDNINIAFRVEAQRLGSKKHFDNGTTATLIPNWDPDAKSVRTPHGTLPLNMKPPRNTTDPKFEWSDEQVLPSPENLIQLTCCCKWQLKRIALERIKGLVHLRTHLESCPRVDPITPHVTEQYPLPAMHLEESSIDGTLQVFERICVNLGMSNVEFEKHGLMFTDGDLLTDSLINKVESARRNSNQPIEGMKACIRRFGLFHCKMAGCRMVINEHWGKPNLKQPGGGLWWENNYLDRANMVAGWQASKATEWKPAHELLQISVAAHVIDGYRIFSNTEDLEEWATSATWVDFEKVTNDVYEKLFSTKAYNTLKNSSYRDTVHENNVLYNRDALFYIELVHAIKVGDIGRVTNVLRVWMIMMRAPKTMPKYADAIFETLGRVATYPEKLRRFFFHNWLVNLTGKRDGFKEVDLLQEHQNFWAKIIYSAKGTNRSWEWLSMITVCIFELRNAMRTVQKSFKISSLSTQHTVPDMSKEIETLAEALKVNKVQEYVSDRRANTFVKAIRDLLEEGSKYANTRKAFQIFRDDSRRAVNLGYVEASLGDTTPNDGPDDVGDQEDYRPSQDDLAMDNEEPYDELEEFVRFVNTVEL